MPTLLLILCLLCISLHGVACRDEKEPSTMMACSVSYSQTLRQSWNDQYNHFTLWDVQINSIGEGKVSELAIALTPLGNEGKIVQIWDILQSSDGSYTLPYDKMIESGSTYNFAYAVSTSVPTKAAPATLELRPSCASMPMHTSMPLLSSSRRNESPSSSSSPSSCSVNVSLSLHPGIEWSDQNNQYMMVDVHFTNTGSLVVDQAAVKASLQPFTTIFNTVAMTKLCCEDVQSIVSFDVDVHGVLPGATFKGAGVFVRVANTAPYDALEEAIPDIVIQDLKCREDEQTKK
eukprot:TRINITY_DN4266_c0_g1_i1.p1 TRINITY_DN4266_c0_g1~~TRINITY_DN4266_c0_g1_i1.p1  ORF type:complete len:307 (+),score=69.08 TRINITY_DN4266_c0_g1_i1:54-923(+)